jgi:hypothetical protein
MTKIMKIMMMIEVLVVAILAAVAAAFTILPYGTVKKKQLLNIRNRFKLK